MSTFRELYSDFQDTAKLYTEKMDNTEVTFMRLITRAAQEFQLETEYLQSIANLIPQFDTNGNLVGYPVPSDLIRIIEIRDPADLSTRFLSQEFTQYTANIDRDAGPYTETPFDYNIPMVSGDTVLYSLYAGYINFYPLLANNPTLTIWYLPDMETFSSTSTRWNLPDITLPSGATQFRSWFPMNQVITHPTTGQNVSRFSYMFDNMSFSNPLRLFEKAFLNYALADFIKSKGSKNYLVFEQAYKEWVNKGINIKPTYFKQGVADYYYAPWS